MTYTPKIDDYVLWSKGVEGWVYFKDKQYITIEALVIPKDQKNYQDCQIHRNNRVLVLCYPNQWNELKLIGYRKNKYSNTIIPIEE